METSNLKNMIILKNLPSNLIEEAIVVFKQSKKVKNFEYIKKQEEIKLNSKKSNTSKEKDYIVKEAEMLVNEYIKKIEKNKEEKKQEKNLKIKYKKNKKLLIGLTIISIVEFILLIILWTLGEL